MPPLPWIELREIVLPRLALVESPPVTRIPGPRLPVTMFRTRALFLVELLAALVRRIPAVWAPPVPLLRTVLLLIVHLLETADDVQAIADRIPDQILANVAVDDRCWGDQGGYGAEPQRTHQLIAVDQEVTDRTADEHVVSSSCEGDEVVSEHQIAAAVEKQVEAGA